MQQAIKEILTESVEALKPPPRLKVSEWADEYRLLSPEASAMPGRWQTNLAEFQRGMMNAINEPGVETIVYMTSAQIGKTEIINNIVGYIISQDPSPILVVYPTDKMGQAWSKDRFSPMVRDTPILTHLIKPSKSKDSSNTIMHKIFPGGHISVAGANSPVNLAARPVRMVLIEETDRCPPSAGSEGDPVGLAIKRSTTFWNRAIFMTSTPTIKNLSRIEAAFNESDQRRYYIPCHKCGEYQVLKWAQVTWQKDEYGTHHPETARYKCELCGDLWTDAQRSNSVRRGEWRPTASVKNPKIIGFHIWEAYSPWVQLSDMVQNFLDSKDTPERLKVFVNTVWGETWDDPGLQVNNFELYERREKYPAQVPAGGMVITCGVDVQDDRLEGEQVAWGPGFESWSIDTFTLYGNPGLPKLWSQLDEKLEETFEHEHDISLKISCTGIDIGGHFTDEVYQFCKGKEYRRIFAVKGSNAVGSPLVSRPTKNNKFNVKLFIVGTDTAKELLYSRLSIDEPGPACLHFPYHYDTEYFEQLTAEKAVTKYRKGFPHRVWVKIRARNEALDCRVYAMAALAILNPNFEAIKKSFENITGKETGQPVKKAARRSKGSTWVNGWKH